MEIMTPIGFSIIGLGVITWICTFIAVALACKKGNDEVVSFAHH
jgi:hypothetical protein